MTMAEEKTVMPMPMPTTGMPDRVNSLNPPTDMEMKKGIKNTGTTEWNPGRKASKWPD